MKNQTPPQSLPVRSEGLVRSRYDIVNAPIAIGMGWALVLFIFSCSDSRLSGFSKTKNGLYYKIQGVGEGEIKAKPKDYITARIEIKSEKDSVLYTTKYFGPDGAVTFILPESSFGNDYREGYRYLTEGDSATFITDAHTLFMKNNHGVLPKGMNLQSIIIVETRVLKIRTPEQHIKEMEEERKQFESGEFEEKKILDKYLADSNITSLPIANGIYYIRLRDGKGLPPDSGRVALINYRGSFLNGRCFDASYENQPFEYIVGGEEQLIKGLEVGVRKMHEGEKAKFILPSYLAFGSSGSSTGIVPPFTTVVYEVELLKVQ